MGQAISHYRIVEKLGGAARRLRRFVALKFLPDEIAKDAPVLARFQQ